MQHLSTMTDEEIIKELRKHAARLTAVELAELLDTLSAGRLSQGTIVTYFKRAFPSIPLRTLLDAGAWARVGGGSLDDEGFNALLGAWLVVTQ
jgi:hypothetical protein